MAPRETPVPSSDVTLVVVSHDGAAWLPVVLDAVREQTVAPERVVAVDTGSTDASPDLLAVLPGPVLRVPATTGYPDAVALGLDHDRATLGGPTEWVWLLHDDSAPAPDALAALLAASRRDPAADLLGCKVREWPSLRRLLEVGVTLSGTGRRETGLEPGEYDQGQLDEEEPDGSRPVLAVATAGLLVRRRVLDELGGLDDRLPVFGADVDLGWRAAWAGRRCVVVPSAVVFHAEAAARGLRRTPLTGTHTHFQQRRAAVHTLLADSRPGALALQVPRLVLATVLRVLGLLAVREPARALDDAAALGSVLLHPGALRQARRRRAPLRRAAPRDVRRLLAPWWTPYRHGLDLLVDLAAASTRQVGDVAERRRLAAAGRDPSSFAARRDEPTGPVGAVAGGVDGPGEDTGLVARFVTNPVAVLLAVVVLASLVAARHALDPPGGGGLSPAPASVGDWWTLLVQSRHPLAQGTAVPAPAYLAPLALVGSVLGGSARAAVAVVLLLAVPASLWGAWRFLRVVGRLVSPRGMPRWLILWAATTYALVPVASGAWGDGRLGPVVVAVLLPWLGHAMLGFADPEPDRRWRAGWRSGLLATVVVAFGPVTWLLLALLVVVVLGVGLRVAPAGVRQGGVWGPLAVLVATPVVLLVPWWAFLLAHGAGEGLLLDAGRLPGPRVVSLDLPAARLTGPDGRLGAPLLLGLVVPVLALLALLPRRSRAGVVACWLVAAVTAVLAVVLSGVELDLAAGTVPAGLSTLPVVLAGALVVAVALGAQAAVETRRRAETRAETRAGTHAEGSGASSAGTPDPRTRAAGRVVAAVLVAVAVAVPAGGLVWFLAQPGTPADVSADAAVPAYMRQGAELGAARGVLVLRGSVTTGLTYTVRRGDGVSLGEDEVVALTPADAGLTSVVGSLVSRPTPGGAAAVAARGIEYVVLLGPPDGEVAASLDAAPGLVQSGTEDRSTRAWRVDRPLAAGGVTGRTSWVRVVVLVLQVVAVLAVLVLCAPSRTPAREGSR